MSHDQEMVAARKGDRLLRQLRTSIDPTVPTQLAQAFFAVWMNEGRTLTEIADSLGANLSTASRQLLDLGDRNRKNEPGYGLVESKVDPTSRRTNRYTLTPKGRLLAKELADILKE